MYGMILYVLETLKYGVLYRVLFDRKEKRVWISLVVGILYFTLFGILFPEYDSSGKNALGYACAWIATLFMMRENAGKRGKAFFVMFLCSLGLEQIVSIPLRIVGLFVDLEVQIGNYDSVILSFFALSVTLFACIWKNKKGRSKWNLSGRTVNFLIVFMILCMLFTVGCVDYAEEYVSNIRYSVLTIILCVTSYVSIVILGVFIVHIRNTNEKIDDMLQNEIVLRELQKSSYEELLRREEETRNYRHDMVGHLLCLESYAKEGNMKGLENYLSIIQQQLSLIQGKRYLTGNQVLDVISNHYLFGVEDETKVYVSGVVEDSLAIDDVSLCSVYMNLLKNAIEELERIEGGEKFLKIDFSQGKNFFCIEIRNSVSKQSKEKKNVLKSEKEDKRNHGIGLQNVKKVVKEYDGAFETKIDNDIFIARVVLKYKMTA